MPIYNKSRGCWSDPRLNMNFTDFITSDEELDSYEPGLGYCLTDSEAEESEEELISIHPRYYHFEDQTQRTAAIIFQKCWRGYLVRNYPSLYRP